MNKSDYEIEYTINHKRLEVLITGINDSLTDFSNRLVSIIKDTVEEAGKDFIKKYPFTQSIKFSVGSYYDDQDYSDIEVRSVYANIIYTGRIIRIYAEELEYSWEDLQVYKPSSTSEELYNERAAAWMIENSKLIEEFNTDLHNFANMLDTIDTVLLEKAYGQSTIEITKDGVEFYDYEY